MRARVLLLRRHLAVGFGASVRLKPGVPAEVLRSSRLDEHLPGRLPAEEVGRRPIPVGDAALGSCRAVEQRISDGAEALSAGCFEEPAYVETGKVAELVEAEVHVFDDEAAVAAAARLLELETGDVLHIRGLDLQQLDGDAEHRHAEDALGFDTLVRVRGDEDQLFAVSIGHRADCTQSSMARRERVSRTLKRSGAQIRSTRFFTNWRMRRCTVARWAQSGHSRRCELIS